MNPFFDWLKDTGTQAMLVFVGTSAAIVAAVGTIYFGRKSLTKRDLAPIEQNTGHLEEVRSGIASVDSRLRKQDETDRLKIRANRVPITARGYQSGNVPLPLELSVKESQEPDFNINHLELYNERDLPFGSFPCERIDGRPNLDYRASIPMKTIGDWFHSGSPDQLSTRRRLKIRVWMSMSGVEVPRDMAAIVIQSDGGGYPAFDVQGNV
jgi:hypothetical protein